MAGELAGELGLKTEAAHWKKILSEFGDFAITSNDELKFAPTMAYNQSHRHFSHMMATHPLGLIKWEDGLKSQRIIKNSIHLLDSIGPDEWCGYSYSWLANMKARAKDGDGAAKDLRIFAKAFCSVNSFHLNGDQKNSAGLPQFTRHNSYAPSILTLSKTLIKRSTMFRRRSGWRLHCFFHTREEYPRDCSSHERQVSPHL